MYAGSELKTTMGKRTKTISQTHFLHVENFAPRAYQPFVGQDNDLKFSHLFTAESIQHRCAATAGVKNPAMVRCRFLELLPSELEASTAGDTGARCDADAPDSDGESLVASEGTVLAA
mmetsp:Transcript_11698/g.35108  ORF Transcript_11698/g.35108 Transcript_11698/m.35108 type:complete len:118 (+) Transcript_11698:2089-2442(+)